MHGMQEDVVGVGQKNGEAEKWWAERLDMKHGNVLDRAGHVIRPQFSATHFSANDVLRFSAALVFSASTKRPV